MHACVVTKVTTAPNAGIRATCGTDSALYNFNVKREAITVSNIDAFTHSSTLKGVIGNVGTMYY